MNDSSRNQSHVETAAPSHLHIVPSLDVTPATTSTRRMRLQVPAVDLELLGMTARASVADGHESGLRGCEKHVIGRDLDGDWVVDVVVRNGPAVRCKQSDWEAARETALVERIERSKAPKRAKAGDLRVDLAVARATIERVRRYRRSDDDHTGGLAAYLGRAIDVDGFDDRDEALAASHEGEEVFYVRRIGAYDFEVRLIGLLIDGELVPNLADWADGEVLVPAELVDGIADAAE